MGDSFEDFYTSYPPAVQEIARTLRAMVRRAMPEATEILVAKDNSIGYSFGESRAHSIVYICLLRDYVRLGFYYGGQLPDPDHRLEGTGKRLRHVKVRTVAEAQAPALERLTEAAWADAGTHMQRR